MNQLPKNGGGGFFDEVLDRYDYGIYDLFVQIFKRLPLATVINDEVFVVHGGLPRLNTFSLEYIKNLPWTTCTTPSTENGDMRSHVFLDMLWSDPVETMGKFPSRRGAGIQFGLDVTASFLRANKLKMIIRSHQCPVDNHGYYVHHQGLCLTVFSASNYCGEVGNWGATIAFSGETWPQYTIAEYWAPDFADIKAELDRTEPITDDAIQSLENISREKTVAAGKPGELSQSMLQRIVVHLIQQKPELWDAFVEEDAKGTTKVQLDKAVTIMESVCGRNMPWLQSL